MSTFVILALLAVIISIVRSVMKPGLGEQPGPRRPLPRGSTSTQRPAPETPRPPADAQRAPTPRDGTSRRGPTGPRDTATSQNTAAPRTSSGSNPVPRTDRSSATRDATRHEGNARAGGQDWYVVLDVPRDAPRSEILSAVKLRIERARHAGDTQAIPRILRAAESGMGSGTKGLRELARKLGAGD